MAENKDPENAISFNSDGTASKDLLGRKDFAKQIASSLVNTFGNDFKSMVFGLNGKWGSGKSTLFDFIRDEINVLQKENDDDNFIIYTFNPWMFSGQSELQRIFFRELFLEIGDFDEEIRKGVSALSELVGKLGFIKYLHSGLGEAVKDADSYLQALSKEKSLSRIRKDLSRILVEQNIKLYIFIDDIDRLKPQEVLEIFQLVKLNANFTNVIYLLAYDRVVVEKAISSFYKESASEYLEKIIQVDYTLPQIQEEKIEEICFNELDAFFKKYDIPFASSKLISVWHYQGLKAYFKNLRHVYRFLNALHFTLPTIYKEINILEFLVLEAIRVFDYEGYLKIYKDSSKKTKGMHAIGYEFYSNESPPDFKHETTLNLVKFLSNSMNSFIMHVYDKRLFDNKYFESYFTLLTSSKNVSEVEFDNFILQKENRKELLAHIYNSKRFSDLLRRLSSPSIKDKFKIVDFDIVYTLSDFIDNPNDEIMFNEFQNSLIPAFTNLVLSFKESDKAKEKFVKHLIRDTGTYSKMRIFFLYHFILFQEKEEMGFYHKELLFLENMINKRSKDIVRIYKKQVKEWHKRYLRESSQIINESMYWLFAIGMFKYYPKTLHDLWKNVFDDPNKVAAICKVLSLKIKTRDDLEVPQKIASNYFSKIFSKQDCDLFIKSVAACDIKSVSDENKKYLEFFKKNNVELFLVGETLVEKDYETLTE